MSRTAARPFFLRTERGRVTYNKPSRSLVRCWLLLTPPSLPPFLPPSLPPSLTNNQTGRGTEPHLREQQAMGGECLERRPRLFQEAQIRTGGWSATGGEGGREGGREGRRVKFWEIRKALAHDSVWPPPSYFIILGPLYSSSIQSAPTYLFQASLTTLPSLPPSLPPRNPSTSTLAAPTPASLPRRSWASRPAKVRKGGREG